MHIYQALIIKGYSNDIANEVAKKAKNSSVLQERENLRKDFHKLAMRVSHANKTFEEKKKYVYIHLIEKGYSSKDVKKQMEEFNNETTK